MKIILASDFHSNPRAFRSFFNLIEGYKAELAIIAGDLVNDWPNDIELLEKFEKDMKIPWLAIAGNNESKRATAWLANTGHDLDLKERLIGDERFFGIGGRGELENLTADIDLRKIIPGAILITHVPPTKTKGQLLNGPKLHIWGHLHKYFNVNQVGETTQIQLKSMQFGSGALLTLPDLTIKEITDDLPGK